MKSFLLIGQSNMAGRGFKHEVPPIYNERIMMLRNGRWQMMTEPIHFDRPVAGVGLAASFAEAWCKDHAGEKIGLIPCAEGGSSIDEWSLDGTLFRHAINEAKFAMEDSELAGILWHQGESDSQDGKYKVYYEKLSRIFNGIRRELSVPDSPFIIGGLGNYLGKVAFGAGGVEYQLINDELQKYAQDNGNCYYATAEGLTSNPDGIHLNAMSQRLFGIRYYEAYRKKKHIDEPLTNEKELVNQCHNRMNTSAEKTYIALEKFTLGKISYEELVKAFSQ
ncbi:sialate O-acetylesterase [Sporolactobacillus shoreicorticis]|uniref:Sialate O-acetylesterase n=1 Tax=Sporolactobacillus shoreicorticis TaxID=1923877 RepID=A0ABW5S2H6_9BACL|nr:sialate O-acetylesterase [Sporolactobacillus shoreicorticis]MCO7124605.1 sialate O-acetylesterase [Sporolactobacillus shoreicorticis]